VTCIPNVSPGGKSDSPENKTTRGVAHLKMTPFREEQIVEAFKGEEGGVHQSGDGTVGIVVEPKTRSGSIQ
jgi:hypothetical protein